MVLEVQAILFDLVVGEEDGGRAMVTVPVGVDVGEFEGFEGAG
jgi:hypothetical protein